MAGSSQDDRAPSVHRNNLRVRICLEALRSRRLKRHPITSATLSDAVGDPGRVVNELRAAVLSAWGSVRGQQRKVEAVKTAVRAHTRGNTDFKQRCTVRATNRRHWVRGPAKSSVMLAGWALVEFDASRLPVGVVASLLGFSELVMPGPSHGTPVHGDLRGMRTVYLWVGGAVPAAMVGTRCAAVIPLAGDEQEWWGEVDRVRRNLGAATLDWSGINRHRGTALAAVGSVLAYSAHKAGRDDHANTIALMLSASASEMSNAGQADTPSQQAWHSDSDTLLPSLGSTFALHGATAMTEFAPASLKPRPALFYSLCDYATHMHPLWHAVTGSSIQGAEVMCSRTRGKDETSSTCYLQAGDMVLFDTTRPHRAPPAPESGCRRTLFLGWDTEQLQTHDVMRYSDFMAGWHSYENNALWGGGTKVCTDSVYK